MSPELLYPGATRGTGQGSERPPPGDKPAPPRTRGFPVQLDSTGQTRRVPALLKAQEMTLSDSKSNLESDLFEKKCIFFINTVQLHFTMSFYFLDIKTLAFKKKEFLYKYMKRDPPPPHSPPPRHGAKPLATAGGQ